MNESTDRPRKRITQRQVLAMLPHLLALQQWRCRVCLCGIGSDAVLIIHPTHPECGSNNKAVCPACADKAGVKPYKREKPKLRKTETAASEAAKKERKRAADKAYRNANPEKERARRRERYAANREKELARCREYHAENRDAILARKRAAKKLAGGDA